MWIGSSHNDLMDFPREAKKEAGYQLDKVQRGFNPSDWKPMASIGLGVKEIRLHEQNEYRVIYVATFVDTVYVLHAFCKKTQKTSSKDIALAKKRFMTLKYERVYA